MGLTRVGGVAAALLVLLGVVTASPAAATAPTARIARVGPAPKSHPLELVLPLRADLAGLERMALAVATPGSPQYAHYQSLASLARRFGAAPATRSRVAAYLRREGATHVEIDPTGLFAAATMPASRAARVFDTPLAQFQAAGGGRFVAPARSAGATLGTSVASAASAAPTVRPPPGLAGLITGVIGLDDRPLASSQNARQRSQRAALSCELAEKSPGRTKALRHAGVCMRFGGSTRPPLSAATAGQTQSAQTAESSSARLRTGTPTGCQPGVDSGGFTPNQYLTAYNYGPLRSAGLSGQGQRVALIEVDGFKYSDVQAFARCFGLGIPAVNTYGVGISRLLPPGGEATLDLEVLDAAAPGLSAIDVFEVKSNAAAALRTLTAPLRIKAKPQVISASLGLCEPALLHFVGASGIAAAEGALEMAAATGSTFVTSSGDQGSADCASTSGRPIHMAAVNYPASSWWVTGVGGTNLVLDQANQIVSQIVWNDARMARGSASGGGASGLFRRPSYQRGSTRGRTRSVPDVSMLADIVPGYAVFCSAPDPNCIGHGNANGWEALGGTSAATPLLAGGLATINQALRAAHRQPLGLVNPLLYATARSNLGRSVFDDVTLGGNDVGADFGSGRPLRCCTAARGYDQASGLGSVNLGALMLAALTRQPLSTGIGLSLPPGQRPVRAHALTATVSCTAACVVSAIATVSAGRSRPFALASSSAQLRSAGRVTLTLRFSAAQLRRLRAALAARQRIVAAVRGVLLDPAVLGVSGSTERSVAHRTPAATIVVAG
jgi:subtilase family serine protease